MVSPAALNKVTKTSKGLPRDWEDVIFHAQYNPLTYG